MRSTWSSPGRSTTPCEETIRVVTGGGTAGMNPVVMTALVQYGDNSTQVRIRAAAKEGLIRQRAGQKVSCP